MENNILNNGKKKEQLSSNQSFRADKSKKIPPEIPPVEEKNWILHRYYTRHEYEICKIIIEQELEKFAGLTEFPHYLKGLILRKEGRVQDSFNCFQNSYEVNPRNVNNFTQIAKSLFLLGDYKRAIEIFLQAKKMSDPSEWEINYFLGECYTRTNQLEDAEAHLIHATKLTKNENPYIALVKLYVIKDRIIDAIDVYTNALVSIPESEEIATELGQLYLDVGDIKRAFQQFGTVLAQSPNYTKAMIPMAYIMQSNGEYDVAFSKYKITSQSMPESWTLWNNIGMCLYGKKKYVSAITCLKRAHYLNPLALAPACNLGLVFLTTGQVVSATIYLCGAVASGRTSSMAYLLLGLALKRLDDLDGAESSLEKAHSLAPQDPWVLINYAVVLDAQKKSKQARQLLVVLNDVNTLIDLDLQIIRMIKQLTVKLQADDKLSRPLFTQEERSFNEDEV